MVVLLDVFCFPFVSETDAGEFSCLLPEDIPIVWLRGCEFVISFGPLLPPPDPELASFISK